MKTMNRLCKIFFLGLGVSSFVLLEAGGGKLVIKKKTFLAEVAVTPTEQARGMMYRQSLASNRCMIFIYDSESFRPIWMKNCLIPLDVAWVDGSGKIVGLLERIPPCPPSKKDDCPTYGDNIFALHFVEFAAGTFRRLGIKKGDIIEWELTLDDGRSVRFPRKRL